MKKFIALLFILVTGTVLGQPVKLQRSVGTIADLVTVPAVSGLSSVNVQDHYRGGNFVLTNSIVNTNLGTRIASATAGYSWDRVFSGPLDVRWFGAKPDGGVTDNQPMIQNAVDYASTNGYAVYVPGATNYYFINQHISLPSDTYLFGDGTSSWLRNTNTALVDPVGYPGNGTYSFVVLSIGNYGGQGSLYGQSAVLDSTYYGIQACTIGALNLTLDTASETNNFEAGMIVFIKSLEKDIYVPTIPRYAQMNKIKSIGSGGVINLLHPLNWPFTGDDLIAGDNGELGNGLDGRPIYIAQNVTVRDLKVQTDKETNWATVYGSAYNMTFENVESYSNRRGVMWNPLAYSTVNNVKHHGIDQYTYPGASDVPDAMAFTYLNNNNELSQLWISHGVFNIGECGSHMNVNGLWIGNGGISVFQKHNVNFNNCHVAIAQAPKTGDAVFSVGTHVLNTSIQNCSIGDAGIFYGILLADGAMNTRIIGNQINGGTTVNKNAIHIASTVHDFVIANNIFGDPYGAKSTQDIVYNYGTTNLGVIKNNFGYYTMDKYINDVYVASTNLTETVVKTATIPGHKFIEKRRIKIEAAGTVTGTANAKQIQVRCGAMAGNDPMITVPYTAGQAGDWNIDVELVCRVYDSGGSTSQIRVLAEFVKEGIYQLNNNILLWSTADLRSDWDITLTADVDDAADAVEVYAFSVIPSDIGQ